ncbi:PLD nuclease N-terminal domain-containing protein [Synoicihabitans lomoniglobus]|uniref:PLD nuclease N-terminal domain-containing protein n=1 Tax=Synoicihabitans lomoniglobus TaxID=2909285 RepID=UPI0031F32DF1
MRSTIPVTSGDFAVMGLGGGEFLGLFFLFLVLGGFVFWLWMLIDCLMNERDSAQKLVWVIVIIFVSLIGAPLYFFLRKLGRKRSSRRLRDYPMPRSRR